MLVALVGLGEPSRAAGGFSAVTVDARSGKVLFSVEPDSQRYPASLTKVMTLYIVFQELKAGRLKLNSPLTASHYSAGRPPSRLGLKAGEKITVENAIKALVTRSANDVAATIGENISGSEKAFAVRMTKTARALGMTRSTFRNASGLPDSKQVTTARDMATLSLRIQRDFPQYYPYFRISSFTYKGTVIRTHNRLLGRFAGTDGIKTGYINASGFNLTSSVARSGKRLVGVVMGARTGASRNKYMMTMLEKQFRNASASKTNVIAAMCGTPPGYKGEPLPVVADLTDVPRPAQKPVVVAAQMSIPSMALAGTGAARKSPSPKQEETISEADQSQLATLLPEAGDEADEADSADEDAAEEDGSEDTPSPLAEGLDWPAPTSVAKNDSQPQRPTTIAAVVASAPAEPAASGAARLIGQCRAQEELADPDRRLSRQEGRHAAGGECLDPRPDLAQGKDGLRDVHHARLLDPLPGPLLRLLDGDLGPRGLLATRQEGCQLPDARPAGIAPQSSSRSLAWLILAAI